MHSHSQAAAHEPALIRLLQHAAASTSQPRSGTASATTCTCAAVCGAAGGDSLGATRHGGLGAGAGDGHGHGGDITGAASVSHAHLLQEAMTLACGLVEGHPNARR